MQIYLFFNRSLQLPRAAKIFGIHMYTYVSYRGFNGDFIKYECKCVDRHQAANSENVVQEKVIRNIVLRRY